MSVKDENIVWCHFHLGQRVTIEEVGIVGRVMDISYSYAGLSYKVEYWKEGEPKSAWCRAEELSGISSPGKSPVGLMMDSRKSPLFSEEG